MSEHPFDRVARRHSTKTGDNLRAMGEADHEASRVNYILQVADLNAASVARKLMKWNQAETGKYALTFRAFHEHYPSFPMLLGSSRLDTKLHLDPKAMLPAMFKNFRAVPFMTEYDELCRLKSGNEQGRTVGLIVPRKGMPKGLIIHGAGIESIPYQGLSMLFTEDGQEPVYVRSFAHLVAAICRPGGWLPES